MKYHIYWLHLKEHKDIFSEGYIGITHRLERRLVEHKCYSKRRNPHLANAFTAYGKEIIQTILLTGLKEYCEYIEEKIRPNRNIGWNIAKGGGVPTSPKGKKQSKETIAKRVATRRAEGSYSHTDETKHLISTKNRNRKLSVDHKIKITAALLRRDPAIYIKSGKNISLTKKGEPSKLKGTKQPQEVVNKRMIARANKTEEELEMIRWRMKIGKLFGWQRKKAKK